MTVQTPRVDEHTRTLRAENDELRKRLQIHESFLRELGRSAVDAGEFDLAISIEFHLGVCAW